MRPDVAGDVGNSVTASLTILRCKRPVLDMKLSTFAANRPPPGVFESMHIRIVTALCLMLGASVAFAIGPGAVVSNFKAADHEGKAHGPARQGGECRWRGLPGEFPQSQGRSCLASHGPFGPLAGYWCGDV